jgi:hypothetical protein
MSSTSPSSVSAWRTSLTGSSTDTSSLAPPCAMMIGSAPPNCVSSAAPGQRKPVAGHALGSAEPVGAQKPGCTGAHRPFAVAPIIFEVVPAGQGTGELEPSRQKEPRLQDLHAVWPYASWNSPAGHRAHDLLLEEAANEPGRHSVGSSEPTGQKVPTGHVTQSSSRLERKPLALRSVWLACVPPGQGRGVLEPGGQT